MKKVRIGYRDRIRDQLDHQIRLAMKTNYKSVKGFCKACGMDDNDYQAFLKRMKSHKGLCMDDIVTVIIKTGWMKEELEI